MRLCGNVVKLDGGQDTHLELLRIHLAHLGQDVPLDGLGSGHIVQAHLQQFGLADADNLPLQGECDFLAPVLCAEAIALIDIIIDVAVLVLQPGVGIKGIAEELPLAPVLTTILKVAVQAQGAIDHLQALDLLEGVILVVGGVVVAIAEHPLAGRLGGNGLGEDAGHLECNITPQVGKDKGKDRQNLGKDSQKGRECFWGTTTPYLGQSAFNFFRQRWKGFRFSGNPQAIKWKPQ